jgi:hypothetical protein
MDADDYSAPSRFEQQRRACVAHPDLGCVGAFAWTFTTHPGSRETIVRKPLDNEAIRAAMPWSLPLIHGTLMVRTALMREAGGYDERYRYSADFDLYDRLLPLCRAANLAEPLLGIRRHPGQGSVSQRALDETLEIFDNRLAGGRFSAAQLPLVRAGRHLHLALCARQRWAPLAVLSHTAAAFRHAPGLTLSHVAAALFRAGR